MLRKLKTKYNVIKKQANKKPADLISEKTSNCNWRIYWQ